jgi:hypothetical protein
MNTRKASKHQAVSTPLRRGFFSPFIRELVSSLLVSLKFWLERDGQSWCGIGWSEVKYCQTVSNWLCSLCSLMFTGEWTDFLCIATLASPCSIYSFFLLFIINISSVHLFTHFLNVWLPKISPHFTMLSNTVRQYYRKTLSAGVILLFTSEHGILKSRNPLNPQRNTSFLDEWTWRNKMNIWVNKVLPNLTE